MNELTIIRKWNYGQYSNDNYGANCIAIDVGDVTFYFSYDTVVAYRAPGEGFVISENNWGPTTGKHLNFISRTLPRIPYSEFKLKLGALLSKMNLGMVSG